MPGSRYSPDLIAMRIAICSDSHDHIPNLRRAVSLANQEGADLLLHCGDLISPFMLPYLAAFHGPVHLIYGNNPGDQHMIASRCTLEFTNLHHHGHHAAFTAQSTRIAINHYPELARELARSGSFDLVCCGHDHCHAVEQIGACLLVNPGDLLGKDSNPVMTLLDTADGSVRLVPVGTRMAFDDRITSIGSTFIPGNH